MPQGQGGPHIEYFKCNKTFLVNDLLAEREVDFMFLTETWLSSDCSATHIKAPLQNTDFHTLSILDQKREKDCGGQTLFLLMLSAVRTFCLVSLGLFF